MNTTTNETAGVVDGAGKNAGVTAPVTAAAPAVTAPVRLGEHKTRSGKMARLPKAIREEVNRRLDDGETGAVILAWLNGEKAVKEVLRLHFGGRAINEQNLSAWRLGGYAEWCRVQAEVEAAMLAGEGLQDIAAAAVAASGGGVSLRQAGEAALGRILIEAMARPAGEEKEKSILAIMKAIDRAEARERSAARARREEETYLRKVADDQVRRKTVALEQLEAEKKEMDHYFDDAKNRKAECESAGKEAPAKMRSFLASEPVYRLDYEKRRKAMEGMRAECFDPLYVGGADHGAQKGNQE